MHRILALWATPRSISTAFERMMIERGDHVVLDEPFSATYYFSPERSSRRFTRTLPRSRAGEVLDELRSAAGQGPVFFKDMAYHAVPYLDAQILGGLESTFLIRDPRLALPSLARRWPDFTADEAGYGAQLELFERVRVTSGGPPVVLDSDALRRDPERTVRAWCEAVGIAFVPDALSWAPGMQPQWRLWRDWYHAASRSTGFLPPEDGEAPVVTDQRLLAAIREAREAYEALAAYVLEP